MYITKIKITNFKCFKDTFELTLNDGLNIIVSGYAFSDTVYLKRWNKNEPYICDKII